MVGDVAIDDPLAPSLVVFEELVRNSGDVEYSLAAADLDDPLVRDIVRAHSLSGWLLSPTDSPLAYGLLNMAIAEDVAAEVSSDGTMIALNTDKPAGANAPPAVDENGNNVPDMYDEFWQDLNDAVDASQLENLLDTLGMPFYIPDTPGDPGMPYYPFDNVPAGAGFDCDDYAKAMEVYLEHTLQDEHPEVVVDFLMVTWTIAEVTLQAHAMVYVQYDGMLYVIDPQTGATKGPVATLGELKTVIDDIVYDKYGVDAETPVVVIQAKNDAVDPLVPPYDYTDPTIMERFEAALAEQGVTDSTAYIPSGYIPGTTVSPVP